MALEVASREEGRADLLMCFGLALCHFFLALMTLGPRVSRIFVVLFEKELMYYYIVVSVKNVKNVHILYFFGYQTLEKRSNTAWTQTSLLFGYQTLKKQATPLGLKRKNDVN